MAILPPLQLIHDLFLTCTLVFLYLGTPRYLSRTTAHPGAFHFSRKFTFQPVTCSRQDDLIPPHIPRGQIAEPVILSPFYKTQLTWRRRSFIILTLQIPGSH
jgi:hypothetical protein